VRRATKRYTNPRLLTYLLTDRRHIGVLTVVDPTAAFDTVDYSILMDVVTRRFSISDGALSWMAGYFKDRSMPVCEVPGRQHLRSARCHQLSVPRVRRSTFWTCAFSAAGPTVWNSLPDHLRDPAVDSEQFRRNLKTYLVA